LLGVYDGKELVYAGSVGTGFDGELLAAIYKQLKPLEIERSPFRTTPKLGTPAHFVRPKLVAEIKFSEWTDEGLLRQPVFVGLRDDKPPGKIVRERPVSKREIA
jgi:bifunctional non-homologous end joining protein LigD